MLMPAIRVFPRVAPPIVLMFMPIQHDREGHPLPLFFPLEVQHMSGLGKAAPQNPELMEACLCYVCAPAQTGVCRGVGVLLRGLAKEVTVVRYGVWVINGDGPFYRLPTSLWKPQSWFHRLLYACVSQADASNMPRLWHIRLKGDEATHERRLAQPGKLTTYLPTRWDVETWIMRFVRRSLELKGQNGPSFGFDEP